MKESISKVIRFLIYSDFVFNSGWGLLAPVFAIFIVQNITSHDPIEGAKIAGFASLVYWITKSIFQIPVARYLDEKVGERDDFWFMTTGIFLSSFVPFGFLLSSQPWHIYVFQLLHAFGMAMAVPSWSAIFTRHIDKGKEAYEWGLYSTSLGFAVGISGAIGGLLVSIFGFGIIFVMVGILTFISSLLLLLIQKNIVPRDQVFPTIFYRKEEEI